MGLSPVPSFREKWRGFMCVLIQGRVQANHRTFVVRSVRTLIGYRTC